MISAYDTTASRVSVALTESSSPMTLMIHCLVTAVWELPAPLYPPRVGNLGAAHTMVATMLAMLNTSGDSI